MTLWSKVKAYFSGWPEGSIERIQKQEEWISFQEHDQEVLKLRGKGYGN